MRKNPNPANAAGLTAVNSIAVPAKSHDFLGKPSRFGMFCIFSESSEPCGHGKTATLRRGFGFFRQDCSKSASYSKYYQMKGPRRGDRFSDQRRGR